MSRPYFPGDRVVCAGVIREVLIADRVPLTDHLRVVLDNGTEIGGLTADVHALIPHADEQPWDRVTNKPATIYTPSEDLIAAPAVPRV